MNSPNNSQNIVLTGGGTGGHITPILAVAHDIKLINPNCKITYIGERGGKFGDLIQNNKDLDEIHTIYSGKFRRYHTQSWLINIADIKTNILNLIDLFKFVIGIVQAWVYFYKNKPNIVFQKGGYVGVPVGLSAGMHNIPLITHDSDVVPGLANRMVSRWVTIHATALPADNYNYPKGKVAHVGVLVEHNYQSVNNHLQNQYKKDLGLDTDNPVLLITGGSSGARRINEAVIKIVEKLLIEFKTLQIVHQVGKGKSDSYHDFQHDRLTITEFLSPMFKYMGAADLVICRASANTLAELGVQGKASIVIPSPFLANGHQLENAKILENQGSAIVIYEENLDNSETGLYASIHKLLTDTSTRDNLANNLQAHTITDASKRLAEIITATANQD